MISKPLEAAMDAAVPAEVTHVGLVLTDIDGQVLVACAKNPQYGVSHTLPKWKLEGKRPSLLVAEMAAQALADHLGESIQESLGHPIMGLYPLPNVWVAPNSTSFYFHALVKFSHKAGSNDSFNYIWCTPEEAGRWFGSSPATTRRRDQAVLSAASAQCASPTRRILLMVRELHRMGFERLRAPAYDYPLAWRCPIVPFFWTKKEHGGLFENPRGPGADAPFDAKSLFGDTIFHHTYTSASHQQPFGWKDVVFATPRELALRFIQEKREIAFCGWGRDPAYAAWFESMLQLTEPNGIITSSFADYGPGVTTHLYTHFCRTESVPLPPGGFLEPDKE